MNGFSAVPRVVRGCVEVKAVFCLDISTTVCAHPEDSSTAHDALLARAEQEALYLLGEAVDADALCLSVIEMEYGD